MKIRKIVTELEEIRLDAGREANPPLRKVAVTAICENPYSGRFSDDLSGLIDGSVTIGNLIAEMAAGHLEPYGIQSYGKGSIVGIDGEIEHAEAVLTTPFGDTMRAAAGGGKAWICHMAKLGGPGTQIDIPLAHKDALFVRSHYDAMTVSVADAPLPAEITITCCFATGGRINHRIGGHGLDAIKGEDGLR